MAIRSTESTESTKPTGRLRNVAVVLAGGTGTRVGLQIPKQLVKVAGKTILEHTLDVFEEAVEVDEIVLLMAPGFLPEANKDLASANLVQRLEPVVGAASSSNPNACQITARTPADCSAGSSCRRILSQCRPYPSGFDARQAAWPSRGPGNAQSGLRIPLLRTRAGPAPKTRCCHRLGVRL